jgi:hypothetical protein
MLHTTETNSYFTENSKIQALVNEAKSYAKQYLDYLETNSRAGSLEEHVFDLFKGRFYTDYTRMYQEVAVNMLAALAKPTISKVIMDELDGEYTYNYFLKMLQAIHLFSQIMDVDNFRTRFQLYELEECGMELSEDNLKSTINEYSKKVNGINSIERLGE